MEHNNEAWGRNVITVKWVIYRVAQLATEIKENTVKWFSRTVHMSLVIQNSTN